MKKKFTAFDPASPGGAKSAVMVTEETVNGKTVITDVQVASEPNIGTPEENFKKVAEWYRKHGDADPTNGWIKDVRKLILRPPSRFQKLLNFVFKKNAPKVKRLRIRKNESVLRESSFRRKSRMVQLGLGKSKGRPGEIRSRKFPRARVSSRNK